MSLIKPVTLTPAKLAANRANTRRSTGPVLARASQMCEWWYGDKAAYEVYGGDATNPQCALESTDRNFEASLFPFHTSSGHGFGRAEKEPGTPSPGLRPPSPWGEGPGVRGGKGAARALAGAKSFAE